MSSLAASTAKTALGRTSQDAVRLEQAGYHSDPEVFNKFSGLNVLVATKHAVRSRMGVWGDTEKEV